MARRIVHVENMSEGDYVVLWYAPKKKNVDVPSNLLTALVVCMTSLSILLSIMIVFLMK